MKKTKKNTDNRTLIKKLAMSITKLLKKISFYGSQQYWESRYAAGGTSGAGSYGQFAEFKGQVLNSFVTDFNISSVIEFGCGDGNQLSLANYQSYIGLDVSKTAIKLCKERFKHDKTKSFFLYAPNCFVDMCSVFKAELALSLDVIYHLVEDEIFELYMKHLFSASDKFVIIYSSNTEVNKPFSVSHVRHRCFTECIEKNFPEWKLIKRITNEQLPENYKKTKVWADFFIYEKI